MPPCFAPRLSSKPRLPSRGFLFLRLDSDGTAAIFAAMSVTRELRRRLLLGRSLRPFEPCLPRPAKEPPAGPDWIHEIKHDGFRIAALENLPVRSCFIDREAIVVDRTGLSVFDLLRYRQNDRAAVLCAFDLVELDGADLRRTPIEIRKRALAELLRRKSVGIVLNAHYEGDGAIIFKHACKLTRIRQLQLRLWLPVPVQRTADPR
jgi:bifunctional non-homologous end joining protein LigD